MMVNREKISRIYRSAKNRAPKFLQSGTLLFVVLLLFFLKIISTSLFLRLPQNLFFADVTKIDLVRLLNQSRAENGLNSLKESRKLDQAAYLKAQDMIQNDYFSHQSPQGVTPWFWFRQVGYNYKYAGENLAVGFADSVDLYSAWLNSPSHRENILNPNYREFGTAIVSGFGQNNAVLAVQLFGSPVAVPEKKSQPVASQKSSNAVNPQMQVSGKITEKNQSQTVVKEKLGQGTVLSQSTDYNVLSDNPPDSSKNSAYFKILNFAVYNGNRILEYVSYLFLAIVLLFILLGINSEFKNKRMVLRSLLLVSVLLASIFLNTDMLNQTAPF